MSVQEELRSAEARPKSPPSPAASDNGKDSVRLFVISLLHLSPAHAAVVVARQLIDFMLRMPLKMPLIRDLSGP